MKPLLVANWKMHLGPKEAVRVAGQIEASLGVYKKSVEVVVCPPYVSIPALTEMRGSFKIGAQNVHHQKQGPFTGEVSAPMLRELGVTHVIVGHSSRRVAYGETDELIGLKTKGALASGLIPIVCVGETERYRHSSGAQAFVRKQVMAILAVIPKTKHKQVIFCYEPAWAISSNQGAQVATGGYIGNIVFSMRAVLAKQYGRALSQKARWLYGGSVDADSVGDILSKGGVSGCLVGAQSLKPNTLLGIISHMIS